jgi:hypothetical protein
MPTRYLKPGVRDSEAIDALSPLAETLFYRLLVTVDDFGRCDGRAPMVKAACYPIKAAVTADKCEQLLTELADKGLILLYLSDGKRYLQMQKWDNVPRAKDSKFPAPADGCAQTYTSVQRLHTDAPLTVTVTGTKTEVTRAKRAPSPVCPEGVSEQVWNDWLTLRAKKRAPVTATVVDGAKAEAIKAGMTLEAFLRVWCARGSQGLDASWLKPEEKASGPMPGVNGQQAVASTVALLNQLEAQRKAAVPPPDFIKRRNA